MNTSGRTLHLNLFLLTTGHHEASWRHPDASPERLTDIDYYIGLAQTAERGKLDSLFLADNYALHPTVRYKAVQSLEPFTLLAAMAMATERIGLIGTASTTFNEPFHVARKFASLDHISRGRAGWNIVTSTNEATALNFDRAGLPAHDERYRRAAEFTDVVKALWDSWEDDALLCDKAAGIFADMDKIHPIRHEGPYYAVQGPLNVPRCPQGHPLLVQAGASDAGKEFAARFAEAVFTAQHSLAEGQAFYRDLKSRMAKYGRSRQELVVLPGFCPTVGDTEAEARELEAQLHELSQNEYGLYRLSALLGVDLAGYPLDGPVPLDDIAAAGETNSQKGRHQMFVELARRERLTIRQLMRATATSRGHFALAGTPNQIADAMGRWLTEEGADGFNVMPSLLPGGLEAFVDKVVPELQNRGLFRADYSGVTLREHYRLARPAGRVRNAQETVRV